jgi:hypothetical protein
LVVLARDVVFLAGVGEGVIWVVCQAGGGVHVARSSPTTVYVDKTCKRACQCTVRA